MISDEVFRRSLIRCFDKGKVPRRILIALSGGVDSLCLTYLLSRYQKRYDRTLKISAVTIDHRYRDGTVEEIRQVGNTIFKWGVDHIVRRLTYDKDVQSITNFEEVARSKRYEVIRDTCHAEGIENVLLAHSLDDQLETFMMRLGGNSSMFGLVGSRYRSALPVQPLGPARDFPLVKCIRPLIGFTKKEIIDTCEVHGVQWFEDHTNKDIRLTKRNLYRYLLESETKDQSKGSGDLSDNKPLRNSVSDLRNEVSSLVNSMEEEIRKLIVKMKADGSLVMDNRNGSLHFQVPVRALGSLQDMFLSRLLFYLLHPISSVKHYHWSYAKLERSVVPLLLSSCYGSPMMSKKVTSLNLAIIAQYNAVTHSFAFDISRQPPIRHEISHISFDLVINDKFSPWCLYDRRFWIRCRSTVGEQKIHIAPYSDQDLNLLDPHHRLNYKKLTGIPVISQDEHPVSLPTYGLSYNDTVISEWCSKDNLYQM